MQHTGVYDQSEWLERLNLGRAIVMAMTRGVFVRAIPDLHSPSGVLLVRRSKECTCLQSGTVKQ
jgi:hypothetical protein